MDSDRLNRWLTLGANVGVIAGIVFLAFELRQNNDLLESESQYRFLENRRQLNVEVYRDPTLAELMGKLRAGDPLDANERIRARAFFQSVYQNWYWEYNEWVQGRLEELPLVGWANFANSNSFAFNVLKDRIESRKAYGGNEAQFALFLETEVLAQ